MLKVLFGTRTVRQSCWTAGCWQEGDFLIPLSHPLLRCTTHPGIYVPCSFGTSVSYRLSWLLWVAAWNWSLLFYKTDCCYYRRLYLTWTVVRRFVDLYQVDFFLSLTILSLPIISLSCPPKFSVSIVFAFSWDDCNTQEKLETIGYTIIWGSNKVYYGQCSTKMVSTEQKFVEVRLNEVAKRFKLATQSKATKQILRDDEGFRESLVDLTKSPRC